MGGREAVHLDADTWVDLMRGHEGIIAMRIRGVRPKTVFLCDFPCETDWEKYGDYPTIQTSPREPAKSLDLRFLVGLRVHVAGMEIERTKELFEACKDAGAAFVIGSAAAKVDAWRYETTWVDTWPKS